MQQCVLCNKKMYFLPYWVPPKEIVQKGRENEEIYGGILLIPSKANEVICSACRRRLISQLTEKSNLLHILPALPENIECCLCGGQCAKTQEKTDGIWLVIIADKLIICENCLKGLPKEEEQKQATRASTEPNAS